MKIFQMLWNEYSELKSIKKIYFKCYKKYYLGALYWNHTFNNIKIYYIFIFIFYMINKKINLIPKLYSLK